MARYTGPITRKSRRLGVDLVGGDQSFEKRPYPPGQHGRARIKESEYRQQLQEKQKARFTYGVMEKQFRRYYAEAAGRPGKTGDELLQILEATGIDRNLRTKDLTDDQVTHLRDYIEGNLKVEGDLRREVQADIRRKIEIGCYQGLRHRRGLPVRGQRTKTNARTRKGPKRTIAGKKKAR